MKLLFVADKDNSKYYYPARSCIHGHDVSIPKASLPTLRAYITNAKRYGIDAIVLSHAVMLSKLVEQTTGKVTSDNKSNLSLSDWAGTIFDVDGISILVVKPFKQCVTVDSGPFLLRTMVNKLVHRKYYTPPAFKWEHLSTSASKENAFEYFKDALYIAVDIETTLQSVNPTKLELARQQGLPVDGLTIPHKNKSKKKDAPEYLTKLPMIDMIGYCGMFKDAEGKLYSKSIVLDIKSMEDIYWMRRFNNLPAPKICQNGGYEGTHLIRYNAPLYNWLCDTFHMGHCQFAELGRKLNELSAMWLSTYMYWKDEMGSNRAEYNAKDTYNTLWIWAFQCRDLQPYAKENYLIEFRKVFPDICCGLEGFKADKQEVLRLMQEKQQIIFDCQKSLDIIMYKGFNANSPKQVLQCMRALHRNAKITKTDDKTLTKWGDASVVNNHIRELIITQRKARKALSTYIKATLLNGRLLYEINHGGTDTGRTASKSSNLWCGTQIQNIDSKLRTMYVADDGWELNNQDGSQAESRTTAYVSEDACLMDTVETAPDFHARNASLFFGIPEDEIIKVEKDITTGEQTVTVLNKPLRKLSKPVNHGSNYNMGASILLSTMGAKQVLHAKKVLNLAPNLGLIATCNFLLGTFSNTYPDVKGKYYDEVFEEIEVTHKLTGATGWTRYCFGRPKRGGHKPTVNKYVAHLPQNLSAMILDEAYFDFWLEYQIKREEARVKAPVHDEVVFQSHPDKGAELRKVLGELISRPYMVKGRTLVIPTDGGGKGHRWSDLK